ncbi:MAG TPA: response regulator [Verrucomicrobiae bacterium]|nr:response regulator [Verrucomicrobiae bacterium]
MAKLLRILMVDDSPSDVGLIARHIERAGYDVRYERADRAETLKSALARQTWDVVLCDYTMPGFSGADAMDIVRSCGHDMPLIFVSGTMGEDVAVEAMKAGAHDYVVKGNLKRLVPAIERELGEAQVRRQKRQAEQAMHESEHKYRQLFECLSDAAFLFDVASRRIIDTNPQAEKMLGQTRGEIVGTRFGSTPQLASLGKILDQRTTTVRHEGRAWHEAEITRKDRSVAPVHMDLTPIILHGKELMLALVRDVTERKQLEEQLRQSQKMEAVGRLAGGVAHDFNNLLAVIRGNAELILGAGESLDAKTGDHLRQVIAASERAGGLTRQLLSLSRKQVLHSQLVDLNDVIGNLVMMLRHIIGEDVQLQCKFLKPLPPVQADVGMVEQVLLNLAINARDAMPQGGQLTLCTSTESIGPEYVELNPQARPGEYACLTVSDTGCGIPPGIMPRIFEPFFTTKAEGKGTGLGLATAYGIIHQHRGWISVGSEVGKGTVFRVYLPLADRPEPKEGEPVVGEPVRGGTETILLVEDEPSVRMLVHHILEPHGYTVLEASSGVAALKIWPENRERIDLVLTDMVMPDGMTGRELVARLHAEKADLPAIYMSGYGADVVGKEFELKEGVNFLQKPCSPQKLVRAVRDCLNQRP